jgi:hypothetical protein
MFQRTGRKYQNKVAGKKDILQNIATGGAGN